MPEQIAIDALREQAIPRQQLFIDGGWRDGIEAASIDVISPIDGAQLTTLVRGGSADVDAAVAAARSALVSGRWSRLAPAVRKQCLLRLADLIQRDALELAVLGVRDNGTDIKMALKAEPLGAAATFRYYAEAIDKVYGEIAPTATGTLGLVHRVPVGVIGAIVPWNFPLMIAAWKLAPALAAGNSVVLKPAEGASLTLLRLAELAREAGLPDGVLNVVTGYGSEAGDAIARHADVDALLFTGSGVVGRRLLEASAQSNLKQVWLELGGKSPNIVFADTTDPDAAARAAVNGIFRNQGQVCVAGSRLLVERSIHADFVDRMLAITAGLKVGNPLQTQTDIGAVASETQLQKNLEHVALAEREGAIRRCGGERLFAESGGFYMSPAIFDNVEPGMTLAREEVFGPLLAVLPFDDEADAVRIANNTDYGLAAAVWTSNLGKAHRMVDAIDAGTVYINAYGGADMTVPMGGVKQSGFGHDKSLHAFDKVTHLKTAWIVY